MSDSSLEPTPLNQYAFVGVILATAVAAVGLFAFPFLADAGLSPVEQLLTVGAVEFGCALVVIYSIFNLHEDGRHDGDGDR